MSKRRIIRKPGGFRYNDGGRRTKGKVGDCVVRAFAIHQGWPYKYTYDLIKQISTEMPTAKNNSGCLSTDNCHHLATALGLAKVEFAGPVPVELAAIRLWDAIIYTNHDHLCCAREGVIHDLWDSRFRWRNCDELATTSEAWISIMPTHRRKKCRSK